MFTSYWPAHLGRRTLPSADARASQEGIDYSSCPDIYGAELEVLMSHIDEGLRRAIQAAGGSRAALARKIGVSRQAVWRWKKIPVDRLRAVEKATRVPRYRLRPDIFE
jgi:ribosome-binding protein aMBF1 (putative translation factor)